MKTFWLTTYALTSGILKVEGEVHQAGFGVSYAKGTREGGYRFFARIGKDAFSTEAEARADAAQRARKKLKSIDKSRAKLVRLEGEWRVGAGLVVGGGK